MSLALFFRDSGSILPTRWFSQSEIFNVSAEKIFRVVAEDKVNASITASSVTDINYFLKKYSHDANQAKQILITIFNIFEVIDVTVITPDDFLTNYF